MDITRRELLALGATAAAALPAVAQTPAQPQAGPPPEKEPPLAPERRVRWAILGIGNFATNQIIPSFAECKKSRLNGFVSGDAAKARQFASRFGVDKKNVYTYDTFDQIKNNPDIDVVYVITPNGLHKDQVIAAARAGKHVFCEKPMANSSKDCEEMIEACDKAGRKLAIAYRAQYEPYNRAAIEAVKGGELGRITSITADHGRLLKPSEPQDRWRADKKLAGGGSLVDIGIYSLNACRYLLGEEPVALAAFLHSPPGDPRFKEVEATVHFMLRFPSGALANCTSSYDYHDVKRFQIFGTKASLVLDPATDYYRHDLLVSREGQMPDAPVIEDRKIPEKNQFALEMDAFSECILENKTPRTPGEEGLRDVRLIEAIYESARANGKTITLKR